ncbi:IS5 family transposase [Gluconobacter sp. LMG 31484]|uniref:IS5 family transposase n=1 Tax=Gluconobacter vitians TaxID=2728102 RepID=A0ABR9Y9E1_9PROT|nr:IS5 family transposase [Gluconobacter vitians]MBF0860291.1 IS5 family transposase [Gluconobacter vitians]
MAPPLVSDELWAIIEPLLPVIPPRPKGGRPRLSDRSALTGILFVLLTGIPWEMLPHEMECGSGVTCWRRLRDWQIAGVWDNLHRALLTRLHQAGQLDWSRACMDSASIAGKKGGETTGPNPTDRGRPGTKRHIVTDRQGIPLTVLLSGANVHDSRMLEPLLDALPPIQGKNGRPRRRPGKLHADKGYDYRRCRMACSRRGIRHRIARKGIESSSHLGKHRWVVERTFVWISRFRRLTVRYERRADIHLAFITIACSLICFRALKTWF